MKESFPGSGLWINENPVSEKKLNNFLAVIVTLLGLAGMVGILLLALASGYSTSKDYLETDYVNFITKGLANGSFESKGSKPPFLHPLTIMNNSDSEVIVEKYHAVWVDVSNNKWCVSDYFPGGYTLHADNVHPKAVPGEACAKP